DQAYVLYYPTAEALLIVVMTREGHRGIAVKIAQKELYAHIEAYRNEINRAIGNIRQTQRLPEIIDWNDPSLTPLLREAQALYDNLITPIEPQIVRKKAVTIVPSGTIYYLPIHALAKKRAEGEYEFVLERWRVSYLPAFRFGFAQPSFKPLPKENVFVFANSQGDLTEAENAANEILSFVSHAQVFVKDQASEEQYKKMRQQYAILVLLNHCRLDPANPQQTYIQLASSSKDDGRLYFNEVQSYRCPSLELAILTACETAIGGNHNGAEILNMASAYSLAGARSIIATLWSIPEYSTKELMVHFYREFFEKQQSPLEALHQAQLSLMKDPRFKHPLFWGAFTFTGDLR
ncbi:MAG: CHAT domain-containing protein, partial [bacterium]